MINVPVYNVEGQKTSSIKVDESALGGSVRYSLLKQAIVMYHANKRVGTAATKSRGMAAGSTRKIFRQKGTGFARAGTIRTGKRVGGGVTFAKLPRDFRKSMSRAQKRLARNSAVLQKLLNNGVVVVEDLKLDRPHTKDFVKVLGNLKVDRSCLVTISSADENLYRSARNVPSVEVMSVAQLNAGDICNHSRMLFTREAFMCLLSEKNLEG